MENAQHELVANLVKHCDKRIHVKLGYQGGYEDCFIHRSQALGLFFYSKKIEGSRYWNAFGLSDFTPKENSMLPNICEINPPVEGLNKRVQGAFARDSDIFIWLLHRGRIGGGKRGIGRKLFFDNFRGEVISIAGDRFAVIGNLSSQSFAEQARNFIQEVRQIKAIPEIDSKVSIPRSKYQSGKAKTGFTRLINYECLKCKKVFSGIACALEE